MNPSILTLFYTYCDRLGIALTEACLIVSIGEQRLRHFLREQQLAGYPISTSKRPPSNRENSLGTPLGLHCIAEKIGEGVPIGGVFKGRIYTGYHYEADPDHKKDKHLITTRILRLRGLEAGKNAGPGCDSYQRYIYIHGTNREQAIGTPQSHGCILLKNYDMLTLYEAIAKKSLVWITN